MNPKTVSTLKKELLSKKETLVGLQNTNKQIQTEKESDLKDVVDRSDLEETWFNKERMSQHWKVELLQIENALQRMNAGSFGLCEECDDEIPVKRLRVRPDATLCLYCQEAFEKDRGANTSLHLIH